MELMMETLRADKKKVLMPTTEEMINMIVKAAKEIDVTSFQTTVCHQQTRWFITWKITW